MNSPGKNTGGRCHSLLQGIFLTQGSNLGLLHCTPILHCLSHQGLYTLQRMTRDKSIHEGKKKSLGLCVVYKYFKAIPSDLSVNSCWQSWFTNREFCHHQKDGGQGKGKWGLSEGQTWIPLPLKTEKSIKEKSTASHFKFNLWILCISDDCSQIYPLPRTLVFSSIQSPISSISSIYLELLLTIFIATILVQSLPNWTPYLLQSFQFIF